METSWGVDFTPNGMRYFGACLDSGKNAERVKKDILDGARSGVTGTPSTFINGRFISGARPYEDLISIIDDELKRKAGAAPKS